DQGNVLVLHPDSPKWRYEIYTARLKGLSSKGFLKEGDEIETGWMGLKLRALRVLAKAFEKVRYRDHLTPSQATRAAVQVRYDGETYWVGLNSVLKLFSEEGMLWVSFNNRRIDLGFPLTLKNFAIGRYQGTERAASYASDVDVP